MKISKKSWSEIDSIINLEYINITKFGELEQLAILFKSEIWRKISSIFDQKNKVVLPQKRKFTLYLSWIDKSPLAKVAPGTKDNLGIEICRKVELADAAFFVIRGSSQKDKMNFYGCRSFLLQAKRAKNNRDQKVPVEFPKKNQSSTSKEFALLSKWPIFDLYLYSASKDPAYSNINVDRWSQASPPYAWYTVCPPNLSTPWASRWMCGPAKFFAKMDVSFGRLLCSFLSGSKLKSLQVGEDFTYYQDWDKLKNSLKSSLTGWDIVSNEIISLTSKSYLPKNIFNSNGSTRRIRIMYCNEIPFQNNFDPLGLLSKGSDLENDELIFEKFPVILATDIEIIQ